MAMDPAATEESREQEVFSSHLPDRCRSCPGRCGFGLQLRFVVNRCIRHRGPGCGSRDRGNGCRNHRGNGRRDRSDGFRGGCGAGGRGDRNSQLLELHGLGRSNDLRRLREGVPGCKGERDRVGVGRRRGLEGEGPRWRHRPTPRRRNHPPSTHCARRSRQARRNRQHVTCRRSVQEHRVGSEERELCRHRPWPNWILLPQGLDQRDADVVEGVLRPRSFVLRQSGDARLSAERLQPTS